MQKICPKCNKEGSFSYFDEPDHTGVIAMFRHKTGKFEKIKDVFGNERISEIEELHMISLKELEKTDWFKKWKEERDKEMEKNKLDMDKLYQDIYWETYEQTTP